MKLRSASVHRSAKIANLALDILVPIRTMARSNIGIGTRKRETDGKEEHK
jgi:hypothetical protein